MNIEKKINELRRSFMHKLTNDIGPANSDQNRYIKEMKFNGKPYSKNWLSHSELLKGATLEFDMSATPNNKRGINKEDFPYSLSNE